MFCNKIELRNFRNIESADVSFTDGVNVLLGSNAQGKTNLLEAVFTASVGKSFRATRDAELVRFGADFATVAVEFTDTRKQRLEIKYTPGRRRTIELNKNKITKLSDFAGRFRSVLFCPEHLSLIKGAPAVRRDFLDMAISQLRPMYLVSLTKYEKILKQRNALLKGANEDRETFRRTIDYWSESLAHEAAILSKFRESYAKQIGNYMQECFAEMSRKTGAVDEIPTLIYRGSSGQESYEDMNATKETYFDLLRRDTEREIYAGSTLYGVHKDDLEICLGGRAARMYASQGQQRSLALALKLAEGEIVKKESGEYPVFLLDDVLSELDFARREYLIEEIRDKQVIMTTCEINGESYKNANIICVSGGKFTRTEEKSEE